MPKKKSSNKPESTGDLLVDGINKKYGAIIESGSRVLETLETYDVISISPALDIALGGGIREGQCVGMTGDPKTGKTTTALYFAAKAQKLGKRVFYINTEGRLTKENFKGIKGLDIEAIQIVQATDEEPKVSAEKYLNTLETLIKQEPGIVCIVDSASNMVPEEELDGEIRTGVRNALPRLLSMFFKRISGDVSRMRSIVIFITHNIANTSGSRYAPSKMSDCGNMLQYQVSTNMVITHRGKWEVPKESGNHVGQVANWKILTSAAGGRPNSLAESWIRYGIGIDEAQEICHIATQFALISPKGAWYTISSFVDNKDDPTIQAYLRKNEIDPNNQEEVERAFKFNGMDNLSSFITENEELQQFLVQQVKDLLL
jgi:recombination protein RecA